MKITLDEIARMAGVSKATVSRVIHDSPNGVGAETRARVLEVLRRVNYDSESLLLSKPQNRSGSVGLVVPDITNPFFAELAREISNEAMRRDYTVLFGNTGFSIEAEERMIGTFVAKKIDGLLLVTAGETVRDGHLLLEKYRIPCVLIDRDVEGMNCAAKILSDNAQMSYSLCEMFINQGSRDVVYITGSSNTSTSRERLEGYRKALARFKIPYREERIQIGDYTLESGYNAILNLERAGIRYSAVLAANDLMAMGAMRALEELGYDIPGEVQVIGYDNIVYSQYTDPPLTTVQQPTIEMGRLGMQALFAAMEGKKDFPKVTRLRPRLLKRKTTK